MDKILPQSVDTSDEILKEYINENSTDPSDQSSAAKHSGDRFDQNAAQHSDSDSDSSGQTKVLKSKPAKPLKYLPVANDPEQNNMIVKLRRWRASFSFFETVKKPIPVALKSKVDKILTDNAKKIVPIDVLHEVEIELQQTVGSGMDTPPTQADFILKTVNPSLESTLVGMGYDISGFSQLAAIHCKEPLVLALIEHDLMGGRKPSPLLMATISYLGVMQFAYYNNKLRRDPPVDPSGDPSGQRPDPSGQSRPSADPSGQRPSAQSGSEPKVQEKDLNTLYNELPDI